MNRLPSLNAIQAFERVARLGSVRAAAFDLHVTPSAVSHQLKRLEQELGVNLLDRVPKGVALTEEGIAYSEELKSVFDRLTEATARIRNRQSLNVVTITTLPVLSIKWLVRRLADFHIRHPQIEVRVSTAYKTQDLASSGYDLGVRWGIGRWAGLEAHRLMGDQVQPVCSPAFLKRHGPLNPQADLPHGHLIHMSAVRDEWQSWMGLQGMPAGPLQGGLQFGEPTSAIQAAVDGLGVVLAPRALVDGDLKAGLLVPAHPQCIQLKEAYFLVHPSRAGLSKAGQLFKDWLIQQCEQYTKSVPKADICLLTSNLNRA